MARMKEVVTAFGTLACAFGIGFVMQNTESASQRYGATAAQGIQPAAPAPTPPPRPDRQQDAVIDVREVMLTSAMPDIGAVRSKPAPAAGAGPTKLPGTAAVEPAPGAAGTPAATDAATLRAEDACAMSAKATPASAAYALLELAAPCHGDQPVTVHHGGMFFSGKTDADGGLSLSVPGLSEQAVFIFAFPDGEGVVAQTRLPDMQAVRRVVLQWSGQAGFELHARAFGADYGTDGHVWHGAQGAPTRGTLAGSSGGHMTRLGQIDAGEPHIAEIYTYPAEMSGAGGRIDLSVEAEITAENCGLEIEAQIHAHGTAGSVRTRHVTLAVPGCDAIGDYLVLNNVFDDMKVAAR